MELLACVDCGDVPVREQVYVHKRGGYWTYREGGTCYLCHKKRKAA
ncbi:hypothetical protein OHV05_34890 [Kitasatospora sp. NBC_00070]